MSWAQRHIDSGLAGVLMTTMPLIILPLGRFFVPGEHISLRKLTGFLIGFAGVGVLIGPDAFLALGAGGSVDFDAAGDAPGFYSVNTVNDDGKFEMEFLR